MPRTRRNSDTAGHQCIFYTGARSGSELFATPPREKTWWPVTSLEGGSHELWLTSLEKAGK